MCSLCSASRLITGYGFNAKCTDLLYRGSKHVLRVYSLSWACFGSPGQFSISVLFRPFPFGGPGRWGGARSALLDTFAIGSTRLPFFVQTRWSSSGLVSWTFLVRSGLVWLGWSGLGWFGLGWAGLSCHLVVSSFCFRVSCSFIGTSYAPLAYAVAAAAYCGEA